MVHARAVGTRPFGQTAGMACNGQVIQPFSMGSFLVRLLRGSEIKMEQTRVDEGIWMPEHVEVRAAAKILFVKSLVVERVLTYSEYRLPQAGVPATGVG